MGYGHWIMSSTGFTGWKTTSNHLNYIFTVWFFNLHRGWLSLQGGRPVNVPIWRKSEKKWISNTHFMILHQTNFCYWHYLFWITLVDFWVQVRLIGFKTKLLMLPIIFCFQMFSGGAHIHQPPHGWRKWVQNQQHTSAGPGPTPCHTAPGYDPVIRASDPDIYVL